MSSDVLLYPATVPVAANDGAVLNALTIDVEDYFHVSGFEHCVSRSQWDDFPLRVSENTHRLLDLLAAAGVRGTFFVLGWVAERRPDLVKDIRAAGHEIGSHGYWHRLIYEQTPDEFRADLRRGRNLLQDILGEAVTAYRAPSFSITRRSLWALDVLVEEGFLLDSSIYPTRHDRYGIPGAPLGPHRVHRRAECCGSFRPRFIASSAGAGGRRRRLVPHLPLRLDAPLSAGRQPDGPAVRGLSAPVGDRPRAAAPSGRPLRFLPALRQPATHGGPADANAAGFPLRDAVGVVGVLEARRDRRRRVMFWHKLKLVLQSS